jgi:hypothetical protein
MLWSYNGHGEEMGKCGDGEMWKCGDVVVANADVTPEAA